MISRVAKLLVAAGIVALTLAGCATGSGPEHIGNFAIDYTIDGDGTVHVVETIDYDCGGSADRPGIDRFLASRFFEAQGQDRVYRYSDVEVSSPTGASALFSTMLGNALQIRVGNAHATVSGPQSYVISYDIVGALNRSQQPDGDFADEFFWNATGHYWDPPIDKTVITVTGPENIRGAVCFAGYEGSQEKCDSVSVNGRSATLTTGTLTSRQGVTIDITWLPGTFGSTSPILEPSLPAGYEPVTSGSNDGPDPFWSPWNWGVGIALVLAIPLAFTGLVLARRRDRKFLGVTPGSIPDDPQTAKIGPAPADER